MAATKPLEWQEISVVHRGKTYRAHYQVLSGLVIVDAVSEQGTISRNQAPLGASLPEPIAELLLTEMIYAGRVAAWN